MATLDPQTPVRADHRFIKTVMSSLLSGKVEHVPEEYELISSIFQKAGGSWAKLFQGSPTDIDLLKRVVKRAHKLGKLTPKSNWEPEEPEQNDE